ncbi:4Fe-4S binding protein [Candidatus Woesearchaeota archaeon]|nr:4Fe-4S binding protein [Candidatus Woesearchaeota archaeon]
MAKKREKSKKRKINITYLRRASQIFFILLIVYGGVIGIPQLLSKNAPIESEEDLAAAQMNENLQKEPRLNLYLPIRSCKNVNKDSGVFQGCGMFLMSNVLTYRTIVAYAFPILFLILLCFLLGRVWCGWACPIGFFQEVLDWIRKVLRINYIRLPRKVNRVLRKLRYVWLSIIYIVSFAIAIPIFGTIRKDLFNFNCLTCPTRYILMIFPNVRPSLMSFKTSFYAMGSIILILFLVVFATGLFVRRFWCRLCPNGAFLSLFNKGCLTTKQKDMQKCTKCGICYEVCPMDNEDVYMIKDRKVVNSKNCVMCFECLNKCPEDKCLQVKFAGKSVLSSKFSHRKK